MRDINVLNEENSCYKRYYNKAGNSYYYISNDELKEHFEKFHYDGSIQNGAKERFLLFQERLRYNP